jgi:hypothetical protein
MVAVTRARVRAMTSVTTALPVAPVYVAGMVKALALEKVP